MSSELEQAFITLAVGDGVRRVQTAEGARFYGQPIGTIITPDMIKESRAVGKAKGVTPPKGGLSKKPKQVSVGAGKASPASNFEDSNAAPLPPGAVASTGKFQVKASTIKGSQSFKVGQTQYSAPAGSKLIRPKNQPDFAYVVTPDGEVHAFNASGEADVPEYLAPVLSKKFKDLKSDDALYKVDSFDAPASLSEQKPGSTLSKNGKPVFKKQANGVWMNEDIGAELTDDDLQRLYDGGSFDLEPANTVEDIDFSKLTKDELAASLESMPDGKQMKFSKTVLTKRNGKWNSDQTGKNISSDDLADMSEGTGLITDKLDNPEVAPEPGKADKALKEKDALDPIKNPENELNDANAMKAKATEDKVSGAEILKAEIGDVIYHDIVGAFTKKDKNVWENLDGAKFKSEDLQSSANMGFISKSPWTTEMKDAKDKFDEENTLKVGNKKLPTVAKFGENDRSEAIKADGGSTPNVFELEPTPENAKTFRKAMQKSLEGNQFSASVYIYDESDYEAMRLFLSDDGKSGIALHNGDEIVSVFSDPKSKNKKVARHLISVAVENGGKRLDAFDTVLPSIYAKEGFTVKSRLKWNDEYAPDGWDKETFKKFNNGEPDVVFMQYENGMEDLEYEQGSGDYVDDYDAGLASTGGKAQDANDYRPESGDPDNEETTIETTKNGSVVNDEVKNFLADGKKISAIKALKDSNKGMDLATAKKEVEALMVEGIQPGDDLLPYMLFDLPEGAKIRTTSGGEFTKNENGNWVTKNGGVYSSYSLNVPDLDGQVVSNPSAKQKKIEAPKENPQVDPNLVTVDTLKDMKPGESFLDDGFTITKSDDGSFTSDDFPDTKFLATDFANDIEMGKISLVEKTDSDDADAMTVDDLKAMKPGDSVTIAELKYFMNEDGKLVSDTSGWLFDPEEFEQDLKTWGSKKTDIASQGEDPFKSFLENYTPEEKTSVPVESKSFDSKINDGKSKIESKHELPEGLQVTVKIADGGDISDHHGKGGSQNFGGTYDKSSKTMMLVEPETYVHEFGHALDDHLGILKGGSKKGTPEFEFWQDVKNSGDFGGGTNSFTDNNPNEFWAYNYEAWVNGNANTSVAQAMEKYFESKGLSPKKKTKGFTNTQQVKSAIEALESHSGFQIKYGLKSLPEDHPLKDQETLDTEVAKAKQSYPDLSPKASLLKSLKTSINADGEALADWELELLDDGTGQYSKIQIGSRDSKTKATGETGGTFFKKDVQSAINILENYDGKLFKNELNKKGNPLGKLSPNDIVGFNKDKTLTKQKFIDLLKKKIAPKDSPAAPKATAYENDNYDISETVEIGKIVPANEEMTALDNAPEGTTISYKSMTLENPVKHIKTDGKWWRVYENGDVASVSKKSDAYIFYVKALNGSLKWDEPDAIPAPILNESVSLAQAKRLPFGSVLTTLAGHTFTKTDTDTWLASDTDTYYSTSYLATFIKSGNAKLTKLSGSSLPEKEVIPDNYSPGDKITSYDSDFHDLENGTKVKFTGLEGNTYTYTKIGPNQWSADETGMRLYDLNFEGSIKGGNLSYEGNVSGVTAEGETTPEADDSLDATVNAHFQVIAELDKAVSVVPAEDRGANGDGYVIVHTDKGPKITWGKFGGGGIATVAVDADGVKRVLIGKRGDNDEWYLPGGAIDENESHLQGSLREFTEEVENGDAILDNIQITKAYQANIGKIEGTDKDWKYVTSVATLPSVIDVKAPDSTEDWELKEYKWFDAEELTELEASGKLHPALAGGNLAKMVGFQPDEGEDIHADILSLMNEPDNLNEDRYDISDWKKVGGGQGGSNPGGVYEDPLGNKYYVKESNGGETPMHNEVIGGALYKAAGVHSNEVFFVKKGDQRLLATPWIENDGEKVPSVIFDGKDPEFLKKAQADFAIDAWLDNYDVVGIGPWNLVADENGDPLRLDPGGSMMFRATGGEKSWWSDEPTAIDDMRFGSSNSSAYTYLPNVFGSMTDDDVKESAKKLLAVTPEKIATIVHSSGLGAETANKLYQTLVIRRQKILDRFGLSEATTVEMPEAHTVTPAYAKGSTVKIKGSGKQFTVELSNNEATAGLVDGKFLVYLNDELTADVNEEFSAQYAFTSGGEAFKNAEVVSVIDPKNPSAKIDAYVGKADWSSGLVSVNPVDGTNGYIQVDKTHISKKPVEHVVLPEGWPEVPADQKPFAKFGNGEFYATEKEDGTIWVYGENENWEGASKSAYEANIDSGGPWTPWNGDLGTKTPEAAPAPVEDAEKPLAKGDSVTILKYNKAGFSNQAKIVSINTEKGTARLRRVDEHGVPMVDANGKPMYATMSLTSLKKNDTTVLQDNGLPMGITMSDGDKNSPMYGAPAPQPPVTPSESVLTEAVSPEWLSKAEKAYEKYRAVKGLTPKAMKDSSTAWNPIQKAMQGDQYSLNHIKDKGYLNDDPALYEEIQKAIDAHKAKYADLVAQHEKNVEEYQKQKSEWMTANGVASYTPIRHEDVLAMDENTGHEWAQNKFQKFISKLSAKGKQGLQNQKASSGWQETIRKLPAILGLRREDVANAPGVSASNMQTWDNIKEATDTVGPIGESFRAVRTISFDRLVGPDGQQLSEGADLTKIIGSIQKDHGAMEIVPGSVDHGGKVVDFYPVVMDLAVPAEVKGMYTGFDDFSHSGEHGMIMEPGLAMYIWDAQLKKVDQLGGSKKWVVKASIIPRDVLPFMNNFEGDPNSHNIFIPGKDTTTGVQKVKVSEPVKLEGGDGVKMPPKAYTESHLKGMAIGSVVVDNDGDSWVKIEDNLWKCLGPDPYYKDQTRTSEDIAEYMTSLPSPNVS